MRGTHHLHPKTCDTSDVEASAMRRIVGRHFRWCGACRNCSASVASRARLKALTGLGLGLGLALSRRLLWGPFRRFFGKLVSATQAGPCLAAERVLPGGLPSRGGGWRTQKVTKSVARIGAEAEDEDRPPEPGSGLRPFGDSFPS